MHAQLSASSATHAAAAPAQVPGTDRLAWLVLVAGVLLVLLGCGEDTGSCGPGTVLRSGRCVPATAAPVCGTGTVAQGSVCVPIDAGGASDADTAEADTAETSTDASADASSDALEASDVAAGDCSPACASGFACVAQVCVKADPPAAWACGNALYNDGKDCHCGCDAPDPDCNLPGAPVVGCAFASACNPDGSCPVCKPDCTGKQCGDDGCGGSCGTCFDPVFPICASGKCTSCVPDCKGAVCGSDGCGGSCGNCPNDKLCSFGACVAPSFADSCVGACGSVAPGGCSCKAGCAKQGNCCLDIDVCGCIPACDGKTCGADGCGGVCGTCLTGQLCLDDKCTFPGCGPLSCSGHGTCAPVTGTCTCSVGYAGDNCGFCAAGYAGYPDCKPLCDKDADCDDKEPCTADVCAADGGCVHTPTQASCGTSTACIQFGCVAGSCKPTKVNLCSDGNACTLDGCDPQSGCVHLPSGATSCDDDKPCVSGDTCDGTTCKAGSIPTNCDDGNVCTADSCDAGSGCVHAGTGATCSTGDACSIGATCQGSLCVSLGSNKCDDDNPCTLDTCDSQGSCQHANANAGLPCDDNQACVQGEMCDGSGGCSGGAKVCDLGVTAGLLAHYTAANATSIAVGTDGAVAAWYDQSGQGRHLTAVSNTSPAVLLPAAVQGGRGVRAAGSAGLQTAPFALPAQLSVVAVVCADGKKPVGSVVRQGTQGVGWSLDVLGSSPQFALAIDGKDGGVTASANAGSCSVVAARASTNDRSLDVIQSATVTATGAGQAPIAGTGALVLGGGEGGAVVGELLVYDHALSDGERDAVTTYLRTAWKFAAPQPDFVWYDASDLASVVTATDGSNQVSVWKDKSGLGRDALVGADQAPLWYENGTPNGKPAVRFDGGKVRLQTASVPSSPSLTVFAVFEMDAPQQWGSVFNQGQDAYFSIRKSDCCGGNGQLNWHIGNNNAAPLLPIALGQWRVVTAVQSGLVSSWYSHQDAVVSTTQANPIGTGSQVLSLGNSYSGNESMGGFVAEIRAYATALHPADRAFLESLMRVKYGL